VETASLLRNCKRLVDILLCSSLFGFVIILCLSFLYLSCANTKMSVEEAKKVTVKMGSESFSPPPRRIDDILMLLSQLGQFDPKITSKYRAVADKSPPENANDLILSDFYLKRGEAKQRLSRFQQALEDLRAAYQYAKNAGRSDAPFLFPLAVAEIWSGNSKRGIDLLKRSLKKEERCSTYSVLVTAYSYMGDLDFAERYKRKAISLCGGSNHEWNRINIASMKAQILEMRGKYQEAELHRRRIMRLVPSIKKESPSYYTAQKLRFAWNLAKQGKLIEAEIEFRHALKERIGYSGIGSELTGSTIVFLGDILNNQGRLTEAEKLINAGIGIMEQSGLSSDSQIMGDARKIYGDVLVNQGKFSEAMKSFDLAKAELSYNKNLYEKIFAHNPSLILALLKLDRTKEALEIISSAYDTYLKNFGERHFFTQEMRALRGIAYAKMNKEEEAIQGFSEAVPILLAKNLVGKTDYSSKQRFKIIIEAYIDLLGNTYGTSMEKTLGINAAEEAFRLADAIRGQAVRSALGASVVRAAVLQPELSDLVRKEQDALNQISAMESIITETLGAAEEQQDPKIIEKLRLQIDMLGKARAALQNEIRRRFPKYSEMANPEPPGPFSVQKFLRAGEALISIYSTADHTYIMAIPQAGKIQFKKVNLGKQKLAKIVARLRLALDPQPETFGDIPEFDVALAYKLYRTLLKPVEKVLESTTDLLIVADGLLGQLPFSVLPTTITDFNEEEEILFSRYQKVPWLIHKTSITRMPSAASVISLRSIPEGDPNRKAFIGFGDPIFNQKQLVQAVKEESDHSVATTNKGKNLHVRGIRVTSLDSNTITTSQLDLLNRLPDTAQEINKMAQTMGADLDRDVFLGKQASEHRVKTLDLFDRQIVAFATHALLPGDLDGLDQPALALSSPSVTGEDDDGLLTAEEILKLKLNADWVVLSACNTGAADGAGAEAVSGLGRAFFYAGTRAILVSMWPVETISARELTTGLFRYQQVDKMLSRSKALRKSMLDLIEGPGLTDDATGKIIASYAHPLFWAPFILVGDSGLRF
jgi:CHAT domain-containing protein